jgi:hypothetical protein
MLAVSFEITIQEHKLKMQKLWGKTRLSLVQDLVITARQRE